MFKFLSKWGTKVVLRVLKKAALASVFNEIEDVAAKIFEEEIGKHAKTLSKHGKDLKNAVDNAPKVPNFTKPEVKTTPIKAIAVPKEAVDLTFLLNKNEKITQSEQSNAEREIESEQNTNDDKDIDLKFIGQIMLNAVPAMGVPTALSFSLIDFNSEAQTTAENMRNNVINSINKQTIPITSNTGDATGVTLQTSKKIDGKIKAGKRKAVRKRNSRGFEYVNENAQAAQYDNPLKIGIGNKQNAEYYTELFTNKELAVYDDPYYSFEAAVNKSKEKANINVVRGHWTIRQYIAKLLGCVDTFGNVQEWMSDAVADNIVDIMNEITDNKKNYNKYYVLFANSDIDIEDFVTFFKVYAWYQGGANVSDIYLVRVYNALYKGGIPPLQNQNADWGDIETGWAVENGNAVFYSDYDLYKQNLDLSEYHNNGHE